MTRGAKTSSVRTPPPGPSSFMLPEWQRGAARRVAMAFYSKPRASKFEGPLALLLR